MAKNTSRDFVTNNWLTGNRALRITAVATACLIAAACQSTGSNDFATMNSSAFQATPQHGQVSPGVRYWAKKFEENPHDIQASIGLSKELRKEKQYDEALGIMLRATAIAKNDPYLLAEMGKTMAERGSPHEALKFLNPAAHRLPADWTIMSARGTALDQLENHREAQEAYQMALTYSPENPVVLTNYGLSLAMEGRLGEAENLLRRAVAHPKASREVKLNLALILGLSGDFEESERIARIHLEPATVEENMAYLRSLLTQPARWKRPTDDDFEQGAGDDRYGLPVNIPS